MSAISVDFEKLLGYKLIVRASRAQHGEAGLLAGQSGESDAMEGHAAILRAKLGLKPVIGLRCSGVRR